jgi:hypothetical protein
MRRHWQYLKYVLRHKWYVFQECLKLDVPIWIAIFHDWDKFMPDEWLPYANYFYGNLPTHEESRTAFMLGISIYTKEDAQQAFALAWMKHQHRNKHHWQYWCKVDGVPLCETSVLIWDKGNAQEIVHRNSGSSLWFELRDVEKSRITVGPMPEKYRREMLADWRGAGRAITGKDNTYHWYLDNYYNIKLHRDTRLWIDNQLSQADSSMTLDEYAQTHNCSVEIFRENIPQMV